MGGCYISFKVLEPYERSEYG